MKKIDIVDIKSKIASSEFEVSVNALGRVLLTDRISGEAIKLMQLPATYSFHKQGKWNPVWEYTSKSIDHPMEGREAWSCSECGWTTDERHDWCTCGADMRASKKFNNKELQELLEVL